MMLESAAISEIGHHRKNNEDSLLHVPGLAVFGVADGIGGLPFGAQASQCATRSVSETLAAAPDSTDISGAIEAAHKNVSKLARELSPATGIGTTLTAGIFRGGRLYLGHIGDSRCYRLRGKQLECLTEDDTLAAEYLRRRARGEYVVINEAAHHTLTRCIGQPAKIAPQIRELETAPGDVYFFTTDGITRLIPEAELGKILSSIKGTLDDTLRGIVAKVLERGAPDNATAVLLRIKAA